MTDHIPHKRRETKELCGDANSKVFKCTFPGFDVILKRKSNLKRHMKN